MAKAKEILDKLNEFQLPVDTFDAEEIPKDILSTLEDIAKEFLGIDTLKTQNSDSKDFHDISVWSLSQALYQAYQLGQINSENLDKNNKINGSPIKESIKLNQELLKERANDATNALNDIIGYLKKLNIENEEDIKALESAIDITMGLE